MLLRNECKNEEKRKVFDTLWAEFPIFQNFTRAQFFEIAEEFKILSFAPRQDIVQTGENVEWFGIVLVGNLIVKLYDRVINHLGTGDMIGFMAISNFYNNNEHKFTITSKDKGFIAIITFPELNLIMKSKPLIVFYFFNWELGIWNMPNCIFEMQRDSKQAKGFC